MSRLHSRIQCTLVLAAVCFLVACSRDPNVRKQKYLESGNRYFDAGKYSAAAIQYQNAIQIDARYADAHFKLAETYMKESVWNGAYAELRKTVDIQPQNWKAQIDLGNLYLLVHQFKDAKSTADTILAGDPNNVDAHVLLANASAAMQDTESALREMQTAIGLDPKQSKSYLNMAALEFDAKDAAAAEQNLQKAIELDPKSLNARVALGNFYAQQKKFPEAEQQLNTALQLAPKNPGIYAALVRLYMTENQRPKAEQLLQDAKQKMPDVSDGYRMLGDFYFALGERDAALREYSQLVKDHPKDERVQLNYVQLLLNSGKLDEAKAVNDALLKRDARNVEALMYRGELLSAQNRPTDALPILQSVTKQAPENPMGHFALGVVMNQLGNIEGAEMEFQQALKLNSNFLQARLASADIALRKGDTSLLRENADAIIRMVPRAPDGHLYRAAALLRANDRASADAELVMATQVAPDDPRGYIDLGSVRGSDKKYAEAEKYFETALSKDPKNVDALSNLANLFLVQNQAAKAAARVQKQISLVPDSSMFYLLLGQAQGVQKDLAGAKQSTETAIKLDTNNIGAYLQLAQLDLSSGQQDEARKQYQQAIKVSPRDIRAYLLLGTLDDQTGKWQEAQDLYKKALDIDSNYAPAANNLAYSMLEHGGNVDVALTLAQTARRGMPNSSSTADTLGWAYVQKGSYALAVTYLEDAIKATPKSQPLEYHLGVAYQKLFDVNKAKEHYQRALEIDPKSTLADTIRKALTSVSS